MKLLDSDKIIGLSVFTKGGQFLGKISEFEVDVDSQSIITYEIKHKGFLENLFKNQLFIGRNQVISIDENKMIVDDNVLSEEAKEKIRLFEKNSVTNEVGVVQSKLNNK